MKNTTESDKKGGFRLTLERLSLASTEWAGGAWAFAVACAFVLAWVIRDDLEVRRVGLGHVRVDQLVRMTRAETSRPACWRQERLGPEAVSSQARPSVVAPLTRAI